MELNLPQCHLLRSMLHAMSFMNDVKYIVHGTLFWTSLDPPNKCPDQKRFISSLFYIVCLGCLKHRGILNSGIWFQERVLVLLQTSSTSIDSLLTGELMCTVRCCVYSLYMLLGTYQITLPTICSTCVQGNTMEIVLPTQVP